jgi:hypothetical protein
MGKMRKCLMASGFGVIGVVGIVLIVKAGRHHIGMYENVGKNVDRTLKKSIIVLSKAIAHAQSVFEHLKKRK